MKHNTLLFSILHFIYGKLKHHDNSFNVGFSFFLNNIYEIHGKHNHISMDGLYKNNVINVWGNNNKIIFKNSKFSNLKITIVGNNTVLTVNDNCENIYGNLTFNLENDDSKIIVGKKTHFYYGDTNISAQEKGRSIVIGEDCVVSHHVDIRTSDSHSILDKETGKRINYGKDVIIGNHVWITPHVTILKGSVIQDDSVVGTRSLVTRAFDKNGVIAGVPAKLVKENITWTKENI